MDRKTDNRYLMYFDSGTSNTRVYLLKSTFEICYVDKVNVGSKNSAIEGSNRIIIETICRLYKSVLEKNGLKDDDIAEVYASGMVTSPYGLKEIPHLNVPVSVRTFANSLYKYREDSQMKRDILLIPGLKTECEEFSFVGNMRGEEIEVFGTLNELNERFIRNAALVLPGSHTHIIYAKSDTIEDILSTFTGELFYALQHETILSPILEKGSNDLDSGMIQLAMENLQRFGFNRAIYIAHCMRIMNKYTPKQHFSYCEGVINGGIRTSLEFYLRNRWTDCQAIVFVCNEYMYKLFELIFEGSEFKEKMVWFPLTTESCYAVKGLKRIIEEKDRK